ncbi:hypothetical protein BDZ97DRAFT_95068 [Flammula alnicola]|nr:hypothetical protein BDZ97DRAFT_95068 [Flammula alnicola]
MSFFERSENSTIHGGEFTGIRVEEGGTFTNFRVEKGARVRVEGSKDTGFKTLHRHVAMGAVHNSGERYDPPRCHPNTRTAVIAGIKKWIMTFPESKMFWLYGAAGAGKSAIAQVLAELCYENPDMIFIGAFFFSRTSVNEGRSNEKCLAATLTYQLLQAIPEVKTHVQTALVNDPLIFGRSAEVQFQELLFKPLLSVFPSPTHGVIQSTSLPLLIIIDGLDECESREVQCYLLETIDKMINFSDRLSLKIVVASRPEVHIRNSFDSIKTHRHIEAVDLSNDIEVHDDIRRFLMEKCHELKSNHWMRQHIPPTWPSEDSIENILVKSSSHFIYAATAMKYIQSHRHLPHKRMDVILALSPPPTNSSPFAALDTLYSHILFQVEDMDAVIRVIAIMVLPSPTAIGQEPVKLDANQRLTPAFLERLLFYSPGHLELLLTDLVSIIDMQNPAQQMRFFHASFPDYLCDQTRSGRFYVGDLLQSAHADLASGFMHYTSLKCNRPTIEIESFEKLEQSLALYNLKTYKDRILAFYTSFNFHYSRASFTKDSHPDLHEFNFASFFRQGYDPEIHKQEISLVLMPYSSFIQTLECSEVHVNEALSRNLPLYQTCIRDFLCCYDGVHRGLADALALADYKISKYTTAYTMKYIIQNLSPSVWKVIDQNGLHLGEWVELWPAHCLFAFQEHLWEVLHDPQKSGQHALDAEKRLSALVRCLHYLCINHGIELKGVQDFDLTGIFFPSEIPRSSMGISWNYDELTDSEMMDRSAFLISKIPPGSLASSKLSSILLENYPEIHES